MYVLVEMQQLACVGAMVQKVAFGEDAAMKNKIDNSTKLKKLLSELVTN